MTIDKNYYNFIKPNTGQATCNCCCNTQQQTVPNIGIFGYGFPMQTPTMDFGYNSFGSFGGLNLAQIEFNLLNQMNSLWQNIKAQIASFPPMPQIPTMYLPLPSISDTIALSSTPSSSSSTVVSSSWTNMKATNKKKEDMKREVGQNDNKFEEKLKEKGVEYNQNLGHSIATSAISSATGGEGHCAHYVNNALEANGIDPQRDNHAYTRANVLRNKSEFTEIKINSKEELAQLPAGSIVVYQRGVSSHSIEHGHTFVATGNGGGVSDHFQNNLRFPDDGNGINVFIPTSKIA